MKLTGLLPAALPLLACSSVLATPMGTPPPPHPRPLPRGHPAAVAAIEPRASINYDLFVTRKISGLYKDVSAPRISKKTVAAFAAQLDLLVEALYDFDPPDADEWVIAQYKLFHVPYKPNDVDEAFHDDVTLFMTSDEAAQYMGDALAEDSHQRLAVEAGSSEEKLARYVREKPRLRDLYAFMRLWGAQHRTQADSLRWVNRWAMRMDVRRLAALTHMAEAGPHGAEPNPAMVEAHRHVARWGLVQLVTLINNVLERHFEEDSDGDGDSDDESMSGDGDSDADSLNEVPGPPSYNDAVNAPRVDWVVDK